MGFVAIFVFQTLVACADWQNPVRAHLHAFVERLERFVVEGVFAGLAFARPDQCFVGVGQPFATEVWHWVGFAPDDVVENPEALVLQLVAHAEHVVIGADDPDCAVWFQKASGRSEPFAGELVIDREAIKLVPCIIDRINF